jgi:hypothetical protein
LLFNSGYIAILLPVLRHIPFAEKQSRYKEIVMQPSQETAKKREPRLSGSEAIAQMIRKRSASGASVEGEAGGTAAPAPAESKPAIEAQSQAVRKSSVEEKPQAAAGALPPRPQRSSGAGLSGSEAISSMLQKRLQGGAAVSPPQQSSAKPDTSELAQVFARRAAAAKSTDSANAPQ